MTHYQCCDTYVVELRELEEVCDACRERIEAWQEDLEFELHRENNNG